MLRIAIDERATFARDLTQIEREQVPFAARQAANSVAFAIKAAWETKAAEVFDRPTNWTLRAFYVKKASAADPAATVFVKDTAPGGGTPPANYLLPQAQGGDRAAKGLERGLQRAGVLSGGARAVVARGAPLDAFGNIQRGLVQQILSQAQGQFDQYANETERSKARNARRGTRKAALRDKNRRFFVVRGLGKSGYTVNARGESVRTGLPPGVYQRIRTGFGGAVRGIFMFVRRAHYRKRFDVYAYAEQQWRTLMPFYFERELAKAVQTARIRGRA